VNLVRHTNGRKKIKVIGELVAEENILGQERGSDRRLEQITLKY
jgi:hypothetical protein